MRSPAFLPTAMLSASETASVRPAKAPSPGRHKREVQALLLCASSLFLFLALASFEESTEGSGNWSGGVGHGLVGALIEARSAERFKKLVEALPEDDSMGAFYKELFASEARHYRLFLDLATQVSGDEAAVRERHAALAEVEGEVVRSLARQGIRGTIHG